MVGQLAHVDLGDDDLPESPEDGAQVRRQGVEPAQLKVPDLPARPGQLLYGRQGRAGAAPADDQQVPFLGPVDRTAGISSAMLATFRNRCLVMRSWLSGRS